MASPRDCQNSGCIAVGYYHDWINYGLKPAEISEFWYMEGKSTLIMQNAWERDDLTTSSVSEIMSLLSSLYITRTESNSIILSLNNPTLIKGAGYVASTCNRFEGFRKFTYTIAISRMLYPDGSTKRYYIQTHIFRFLEPLIPRPQTQTLTLVQSTASTPTGANPNIEDEEIAEVILQAQALGGTATGGDLNGLGLRLIQEYYQCLVDSPELAAREFFWDGSLMKKGGPEPEWHCIRGSTLPDIESLLASMSITQVTVTDLYCLHEPHTNTLLVDVTGIAMSHNHLRPFTELFAVSPPLKNNGSASGVGRRRGYRFAISILQFIDPLPTATLKGIQAMPPTLHEMPYPNPLYSWASTQVPSKEWKKMVQRSRQLRMTHSLPLGLGCFGGCCLGALLAHCTYCFDAP